MIKRTVSLTPLVILTAASLAISAMAEEAPGYLHAKPEALARWRAWRFGMFIHWGPVSLKGTEISWSRAGERRGHRSGRARSGIPAEEYDNLYKQFNPVNFNADEWVRLAQEAGMKYMVFTTKHHDGFVEFDSKLTDYKITSPESPFGRDIVGELSAACHRAGLGWGCYYSPPDWHHPDYRTPDRHDRYIQYLHGQIRELCSNYGRVDILWFDGLGGSAKDWNSVELFRLIRSLQPDIVINNRGGLPGDFYTPEQRIGKFDHENPWETCMTICRQWSWKPNDRMKSLQQCLQTLVRTVGGDGNLLFNVGPMPDGRIEPRQADRLREMGAWLKKYGDSIYATRGGPYKPGRWGASTNKDQRIFLHVLDWQGKEALELPPLPRRVLSARVLTGGEVKCEQTTQALRVRVDGDHRDDIDTLIELRLDGSAGDIEPISTVTPSGSLAVGKPATASNVYRRMNGTYGPQKAFDDDEETRWATDAGTHQAWLEVDLKAARAVGRALILEACGSRVRKFQLQWLEGDQWRVAAEGTTIGERCELSFAPVSARRFRLQILQATEGPTLWEFQLLPPQK